MEHKNYVILIIYIIWTCFLSEKLCGCKTWSLALRKENIWRTSENRVPRRMYWHMTEEVGDLRKLYEEPHYLYTAVNSCYQIKEDNLRNACKVKGRDHSWVLGIEGRKIFKKNEKILEEDRVRMWFAVVWLRITFVLRLCIQQLWTH